MLGDQTGTMSSQSSGKKRKVRLAYFTAGTLFWQKPSDQNVNNLGSTLEKKYLEYQWLIICTIIEYEMY